MDRSRGKEFRILLPPTKITILILFYFLFIYDYYYFLSFVFLGLHLRHMEVLRLGVKLELLLPACTHQSHSNVGFEPHLRPTPQLTATPDP